MRIKEQETRLTLHEHDDGDENEAFVNVFIIILTYAQISRINIKITPTCFGVYFKSNFTPLKRVGTLIVATIYLQLIQNRYMFRSFTVLQCRHQHCVQPVASDVEVVGYL